MKQQSAAAQRTMKTVERMAQYAALSPLPWERVRRLQNWLQEDPQHRLELAHERAKVGKADYLRLTTPQRSLPERALQALAPQRQRLSAAVLTALTLPRPIHAHDELALRVLGYQDLSKVPQALHDWLQEPQQWQAFIELEELWQALLRAHTDLLCAGVPVAKPGELRRAKPADLRRLALYYGESLRHYRRALWNGRKDVQWRLRTAVGQQQLYKCTERSRLRLMGDTDITLRLTPQRRTLEVRKGGVSCNFDPYLNWLWEIRVGELKVQLSSGNFSVGYVAPDRVQLRGECNGVQVIAKDGKPRELPAAVAHPDFGELLIEKDAHGEARVSTVSTEESQVQRVA